MPTLNMPDVGESVTEGTITRWLKGEGDAVQLDEPIVEIETEKVSVEVPSPFEGRLTRILVQEGEVAPVGAPLAEFDAEQKTESREQSDRPARPVVAAAAPLTAAAPIATNGASPVPATPEQPHRTRRYSPVVLQLASEHDIDLALVRGTGIEGRVTRQDVMRYIENPVAYTVPPSREAGVVGVSAPPASPPAPSAHAAAASTPAPDGDEVQPLSATRRTIAARMLDAHLTIPPAWMVVEADVSNLVRLREATKEGFQRTEGVPLTYLPFFVQAVVAALKQHPALNATYTDEGVRVHHACHIGVAVAVESGLIVPVVRDADRKSIAGLAHEIVDLGAKARDRKLSLDEVRGATFTLDNTGAFGSVISQPLIPPGQVAIMTTEAIRRELRVAEDGSFAARSVMNLCISFDHRALDGAQAGMFMRSVKEHLEAIRADQQVY
jgi:2-oxoisovalerate dehydrogenase E2 component (dihydrolipoyl transacylase)